MKRRDFLKAIAVLPVVPVALKEKWAWAEEEEETPRCGEATEPAPGDHTHSLTPQREILAYAEGDPMAITVVVPPGRLVRVFASAFIAGVDGKAGLLSIYEDKVLVGQFMGAPNDAIFSEVVLAPTPGCHTYRMAAKGNVSMWAGHRPRIWAELLPGNDPVWPLESSHWHSL